MNFNVYIDDSVGKKVMQVAKTSKMSRNAIVRQALEEWLEGHFPRQWPETIMKFSGVAKIPPFEKYRNELSKPKDDVFST